LFFVSIALSALDIERSSSASNIFMIPVPFSDILTRYAKIMHSQPEMRFKERAASYETALW
jgi:hypothetical protein